MPWYKAENGDLLVGGTVDFPGGAHLTDTPGPPTNGWQYFGNLTAAYAALGVTPKVHGADRQVLQTAIDAIQSTAIRNSLISIRDNDPDGGAGTQSVAVLK